MNTIEMIKNLARRNSVVASSDVVALIEDLDAVSEKLAAVVAERDALAVGNSMYREAIRTARRLINVDEMGDADVVLAKAERSISSNAAAVRGFHAEGVEKAIERLMHKFAGSASIGVPVMTLEHLAKELREGK